VSPERALRDLLNRRLLVCCGSGGVGKTTVAAALALRAACEGRRVLVLTIDPARRLADSLGVGPLGNDPVPIPPQRLAALGAAPGGELWALMLDSRRTFDDLVTRFSPTSEIRERILTNRYYQQISGSMVGSQEYMAMERLLDVREQGRFDLIVLDTPPSRHALDFLRAPRRLRGVLQDGVLSWLTNPSSFLMRRIGRRLGSGGGSVLQILEKVLGFSMIGDLSEFVMSFKDLLTGFNLRAAKTDALLHDPETFFVLVTSPRRLAMTEAAFFYAQLAKNALNFGGFIVNRTIPVPGSGPEREGVERLSTFDADAWRREFPEAPPPGLSLRDYHAIVERLRERLRMMLELGELDRANLSWLKEKLSAEENFFQIPEMPTDVHDLTALFRLGRMMEFVD